MDQKLSVDHSWKAFFRLQAVLVPVWGLLNTVFVWRSFQYLPTHPTLARAFLIGLTATVGISLVSVMFRAILGSNRGIVFPFGFLIAILGFLIAIRPIDPNGSIGHVLGREFFSLIYLAFLVSMVAYLLRRWERNGSKLLPSISPLADAELDARSP
jgi:drug/metabolite transporter (DMT)-like permease